VSGRGTLAAGGLATGSQLKIAEAMSSRGRVATRGVADPDGVVRERSTDRRPRQQRTDDTVPRLPFRVRTRGYAPDRLVITDPTRTRFLVVARIAGDHTSGREPGFWAYVVVRKEDRGEEGHSYTFVPLPGAAAKLDDSTDKMYSAAVFLATAAPASAHDMVIPNVSYGTSPDGYKSVTATMFGKPIIIEVAWGEGIPDEHEETGNALAAFMHHLYMRMRILDGKYHSHCIPDTSKAWLTAVQHVTGVNKQPSSPRPSVQPKHSVTPRAVFSAPQEQPQYRRAPPIPFSVPRVHHCPPTPGTA
jgi:hypothetical protein